MTNNIISHLKIIHIHTSIYTKSLSLLKSVNTVFIPIGIATDPGGLDQRFHLQIIQKLIFHE